MESLDKILNFPLLYCSYLPHPTLLSFCVCIIYLVSMCSLLNQLKVLFKLSKSFPSVLRYFEISLSFHLFWRNADYIILVWLPCMLTGTTIHSGISFHCYPRNSFCFPPVVELLFPASHFIFPGLRTHFERAHLQ